MSIATQARIAFLKRRARGHYLEYQRLTDSLSCGTHLAEHVSAGVLSAKLGFNAAMAELAKIDPLAPTRRL